MAPVPSRPGRPELGQHIEILGIASIGFNRKSHILGRFFGPKPTLAKSPISSGLLMLGVCATGESDEFDNTGLGRFRSREELGISYEAVSAFGATADRQLFSGLTPQRS